MKKYYSLMLFLVPVLLFSCSSDDSIPENTSQKTLKSISDNIEFTGNFEYDSAGNLISYKAENIGVDITFDWANGYVKKITSINSTSNSTTIYTFISFTETNARASVENFYRGSLIGESIIDYTFSGGLLKSYIRYPSVNINNPNLELYYSHDAKGNLTNIQRKETYNSGQNVTNLLISEWDEGKKLLPHFATAATLSNWFYIPFIPGFDLTKNNVISYQDENDNEPTRNEFEYDSDGYVTSFSTYNDSNYYLTYE